MQLTSNDLPAPLRRYYTPYEVAMHNTPEDCWVSIKGEVYNLSSIVQENTGVVVQPIIASAGTDISHWFDDRGNLKTHMCPVTHLRRPYCPSGRFVHVPPLEPVADWDTAFGTPWWKNKKYKVGLLSRRTCVIRIKNVLTNQEDHMEVPSEETIGEIRERYLELNWHAKSYTWKALIRELGTNDYNFRELDMNKTLEQNGIPDEVPTFEDHQIPTEFYVPVLHVHWNDDLTVA